MRENTLQLKAINSVQLVPATKPTDIPSAAYIHIPFCRRRCYYCDFPISVLGDKVNPDISTSIADYVSMICREIEITSIFGLPLKTVFFGGGTPSLLPVKYLERILEKLSQRFCFVDNVEISLEIDPGTFTKEQIQGYSRAGVTRMSLGVQAFQDELLKLCGRSHSSKDIFTAIELIRQVGISNLSLDLISGLPHQSLAQWEDSLSQAISLAPNHLSCYDLVLEPVTAFGKQYQPGKNPLPTDEDSAAMYRLASSLLRDAGYEHYEISNYAQPGYQCQHNRVYWENRTYYAFGMGAASYFQGRRFTRPRTRREYYAWVESGCVINEPELSATDIVLEKLMLGLRLAEGVSLAEIVALNPNFLTQIWHGLKTYYQQGLVEVFAGNGDQINNLEGLPLEGKLRLNDPEGFLFSNTVLAALFEQCLFSDQ